MDTLIPAALVLIVTNIVFALLANHWRRQAKQSEHAAMGMALSLAHTHKDSYAEGWSDCERVITSRMYQAALKAERHGLDILAALRKAGRGLDTETEEPIVQVPEAV